MGQDASALSTGLADISKNQMSDSALTAWREDMLETISGSLFFFCKYILGFAELDEVIHGAACKFVSEVLHTPNGFGLFEDPRGHFKSSIATIAGPLHMVMANPMPRTPYQGANTRIGIVSSKKEHACNFLRAIRWQLDSNQLLRLLRPGIFPQDKDRTDWSTKAVTLQRTEGFTQPTFDTLGAESGAASKHYNVCLFDDLIHEKNYKSETEVANAIEIARISRELTGIEGGARLFVGNQWDMFDLNNGYLRSEELYGIIKIFSRSATACKKCYLGRPMLKTGALEEHVHEKPMFPLLPAKGHGEGPMTFDELALIRRQLGSRIYMAQLENECLDPSILDFSVDWLRYFYIDHDENSRRYICFAKYVGDYNDAKSKDEFETTRIPLENMFVYMLVDPALSEKSSGSRTAIMTVATERSGPKIFLLDAWAKAIDASAVPDAILAKYKEWRPRRLGIENVAYQRLIGPTLKRIAAAEHHIRIPEDTIVECKTGRSQKDDRIRAALAPIFEARHVYVQKRQSDFIDEYRKFPRGALKDMLDALSYLPQVWHNISHLSAEERKRRRKQAWLQHVQRLAKMDPVTKGPLIGGLR